MERTFKKLTRTQIKNNSEEYQELKNDIDKLYEMGIVVKENGLFCINAPLKYSKSVTDAKNKLKRLMSGWYNTIKKQEKAQELFREKMVDYFKSNPIGEVSIGESMWFNLPGETPQEYKTGKGYCYIMEGHIVSLHFGYKPPSNAPTNCDRLKFELISGMGLVINE